MECLPRGGAGGPLGAPWGLPGAPGGPRGPLGASGGPPGAPGGPLGAPGGPWGPPGLWKQTDVIRLEQPWDPPGALLGPSGGRSWGPLGALLGPWRGPAGASGLRLPAPAAVLLSGGATGALWGMIGKIMVVIIEVQNYSSDNFSFQAPFFRFRHHFFVSGTGFLCLKRV